jgi:hypothetical protein
VYNLGSQPVFICFIIPNSHILQVQEHALSTFGISRVTVWFVTFKLGLGQVHQEPTSNCGSWAMPMWVLISKLDALNEIPDSACRALSF